MKPTDSGRHAERKVQVRRVDECETLDELFRHCFPAFGGAFLRRVYTILDRAISPDLPCTALTEPRRSQRYGRHGQHALRALTPSYH